MLKSKSLDEESKLEVIYSVLKDQLRKAKADLLQIKKHKEVEKKAALELQLKIKQAQERTKNSC